MFRVVCILLCQTYNSISVFSKCLRPFLIPGRTMKITTKRPVDIYRAYHCQTFLSLFANERIPYGAGGVLLFLTREFKGEIMLRKIRRSVARHNLQQQDISIFGKYSPVTVLTKDKRTGKYSYKEVMKSYFSKVWRSCVQY